MSHILLRLLFVQVVGSLTTTKGTVNFTVATHAIKDVNYANILTTVRL